MKLSSSAVNTLPVGLFGLFISTNLVLSEKAAVSASRGSAQSGGDSGTTLATAPARCTIGRSES